MHDKPPLVQTNDRRMAIIGTKEGWAYRRLYASFGLNELTNMDFNIDLLILLGTRTKTINLSMTKDLELGSPVAPFTNMV